MTLFIDTTLKYYYVRSIINNTYITNYLLTDNNYLLKHTKHKFSSNSKVNKNIKTKK